MINIDEKVFFYLYNYNTLYITLMSFIELDQYIIMYVFDKHGGDFTYLGM